MLPPVEASAYYEKADYSLIVGPRGEIPVAMHRLSVETLTLSFSPDQHILTGLDAYTNTQRWERQTLVSPLVDQEAAMICTEPFDEHGIGMDSADPVRYIYSEETGLLLMELGRGQVVTRTQCLRCAICGLGADGELLEIWVQRLGFDHGKESAVPKRP